MIESYPTASRVQFGMKDPVAFIGTLKDWFTSAREGAPEDSELQNILDEVATVIDSAKYKLENLE